MAHQKPIWKFQYSPEMQARIDAREVDESDVYQATARAFSLFGLQNLEEHIAKYIAGQPAQDLRDGGQERLMEDAKHYAFDKAVEQLQRHIKRNKGKVDVCAVLFTPDTWMQSQPDKRLGTILEIAYHGNSESLSGISKLPLMVLLAENGMDAADMIELGDWNRHITHRASANLAAFMPDEYCYMLQNASHVKQGNLIFRVRFSDEPVSYHFDTIRAGLEMGLSLYDTNKKTQNTYDTLSALIIQELGNFEHILKTDPTNKRLQRGQKYFSELREIFEAREKQAQAFRDSFTANPNAALLTRENMLLLSNIDALESTLCAGNWSPEEAAKIAETVQGLPPFVQQRIPVAISTLEGLAGDHLRVGQAEHKGMLASAPAPGKAGGKNGK